MRSFRAKSLWTLLAILLGAAAAIAVAHVVLRPNPSARLREAREASARRDQQTAKAICDEILAVSPDHEATLMFRSELAMRDRDFARAIRLLERVGDDSASAGSARYLEGTALLSLGRAREAEASLAKSLELVPGGPAQRKLRELYMLQLRRDDCRALLRAGQAPDFWGVPDLLDFLVVGQVPKQLLGNWLDEVRKFVAADADDVQSQLAVPQYLIAAGRYAEATDAARSLLGRQPKHQRARALVADALLYQDNVDEAREVLEGLPLDASSDSWIWRSHGRLAMSTGDYVRAADCFRAALRLAPGDPTATYQLGLALERLGEADEAARLLRCGSQWQTLLDRGNQILTLFHATRDPRSVQQDVLALGELMLESQAFEDAACCFALVVHVQPGHERARELRARAQAELAKADTRRGVDAATAKSDPPRRTVDAPAADDASPGDALPLRFQDVAGRAGLSFHYFPGDTGKKYLFETLGGGVLAFDFDGDGRTDLYFAQGARYPVDEDDVTHRDQLFRNAGDRFGNVTDAAMLGDTRFTIGCSAGDYDDDGFADVFVANYGDNRTYRNHGDGTFSDVTAPTGTRGPGMSTSLALADLDRDGDLDLYVANYLTAIAACPDRRGKMFACHPSMFHGEPDILYANLGDGRFEDVTEAAGMTAPEGKGLGVIVADLDDDEWPDVFVANDTTPNFLFRNRSREPPSSGRSLRFEECGLSSGAALSRDGVARAGMGIACADLDDNGLLDLYVTNYYLETNGLFLNQGRLLFVDSPTPASLVAATNELLGFGTQAIDVDLDGHVDLFVTNGHIDDYRERDPKVTWKMPPKLYRGRGRLRFDDVSRAAGAFFDGTYLGRGVARLDWNRDAKPDLVVVHQNEPVALLENVTACGHRVVLEFTGVSSNRDAVNTRYWVTCGGERRVFEIAGGDGYLATNERRQIVGLGSATAIDSLEVLWPSGRRDRWENLPADRAVKLTEGRVPTAAPLEAQ